VTVLRFKRSKAHRCSYGESCLMTYYRNKDYGISLTQIRVFISEI